MSYLKDDPEADFEFETSSEHSDDEANLEPFRLANIKDRPPIFDAEGLHEVLEDMAWTASSNWIDTQVITLPNTSGDSVPDIHDDMTRELAFYTAAKTSADDAIHRFDGASIPWQRPPDYYAESVKSDGHMAKVKEQLMFEEQAIEMAEQRKKNREMKAFSKQVQTEKEKSRTKAKKDHISDITKIRKQRQNSGFSEPKAKSQAEACKCELEFDKDMKVKQRNTPDKAGQRIRNDLNGKGKKREVKDAKFGFGGRKKLQKQNTAESSADMNALSRDSAGRKSAGRGGRGGGSRGGGGGRGGGRGGNTGSRNAPGVNKSAGVSKRPGKNARQAGRGRGGGGGRGRGR